MEATSNTYFRGVCWTRVPFADDMLLLSVEGSHRMSAHSEAVITANLSRTVALITEALSHSTTKAMTVSAQSCIMSQTSI